MAEYLPILIVAGVMLVFAVVFVTAAILMGKDKASKQERFMNDGELIRRLLPYAKPYWKSFLLALVITMVSLTYDLMSPYMIGNIEELVKQAGFTMSALISRVVVYAGILIVAMICTYFQSIILQKTGQKILSGLRLSVFSHIEQLSHNQLNQIPTGKLVTRVTNDTNAISMMFTNVLVNMTKQVLVLVGVLAAMFLLNPGLTLVMLIFVPFVLLYTVLFRRFSRRAHRQVTDARTNINTFLSENLSGMKITQIFNREEEKMQVFLQKSRHFAKTKQERIFVFGIFRPLVYMTYISTVMALFYFSGRSCIEGSALLGQVVTSGLVVSFYMYASKFFNPIQTMAEQFDILQSAFASAEKIFTIIDMVPEVVDDEGAQPLEEIRGEIEFKDVWFSYIPGEWVLKGVSFHVKPHETVAFVGSTGSGKTTILSLICRNYDIQKGQILIDGRDIRTISIASLRRHFGQMLQDVFLFSGTIRSNILLNLPGVSDEEVMEVCRYVNADGFINRMDKGLDEEVRENGNNFSAGQRQLLSFARTIIHKPSVMILDEATANIDTETEVLIQDSLERMKNIGTMLIVAHRLSTIQHADNIILLSHGQILEQGNHQELLAKKGPYYQLYTLQYHKDQLSS